MGRNLINQLTLIQLHISDNYKAPRLGFKVVMWFKVRCPWLSKL